jgi:hypothetical protein
MTSESTETILRLISDRANSTPSALEFELAYQARVAIERIRFAIRVSEHSCGRPEQVREANFQLLDALGRLEAAERSFQQKSRTSSVCPIREDGRQRAAGAAAD